MMQKRNANVEDTRRFDQLADIERQLTDKEEEVLEYENSRRIDPPVSRETWFRVKSKASQLVGVLEKIQCKEIDSVLCEGLQLADVIKAKRKALNRKAETLIKRATIVVKHIEPNFVPKHQNDHKTDEPDQKSKIDVAVTQEDELLSQNWNGKNVQDIVDQLKNKRSESISRDAVMALLGVISKLQQLDV